MSTIVRQSIKGSLYSYMGIVIGAINVMVLYPRFLVKEQFGLIQLLLSAATLFSVFAQFGMPSITLKFFPKYKSEDGKHNGWISFMFLFVFVSTSIFTVLFYLFRGQIIDLYSENSRLFTQYIDYALILTFGIIVFNIFSAYLNALMNISLSKLVNELINRVMISLGVLSFYLDIMSFDQFLLYVILIYAVLAPGILFIELIRRKQIKWSFPTTLLKGEQVKPIITYGSFGIIGTTAGILVAKLDIFMVGILMMDGLDEIAVYSVGMYIANFIETPKRSISKVGQAIVAQAWEKNDIATIQKLYSKSSINQFLFALLIWLGMFINLPNIFALLPEEYDGGQYVILFIGLTKIFDMAAGINGEIIMTSKYYRFNIVLVSTLVILAFVTNLYFIPIYGLTGAALATCISIFSFNLFKFLFVLTKFKLSPFESAHIKILLTGAIALLSVYFIPRMDNTFVDIFIRSIPIILIYIVLSLKLKISVETSDLLLKILGFFKLDKLTKSILKI